MRKALFLTTALALSIILLGLSLFTGPVAVSPTRLLAELLNNPAQSKLVRVVTDYHLVRGLTALLAGAALGLTGLYGQTLFRNPMADAQVLGISSGAGLGAALVLLAAGNAGSPLFRGMGMTAGAVAGGLAMTLLLLPLVRRRGFTMTSVLLTGLMVGQLAGSGILLLVHFGDPQRIKGYLGWSFGSFSGVSWRELPLMAMALIPAGILALIPGRSLNALLAGEEYARSAGVRTENLYRFGIVIMALLTGAVTAFCGPVGFIGLAVPHLCRFILKTTDHRILLPAVALAGAVTAQLAGLLSALPGGGQSIPVNAITALIGAPVILWYVLRRKGSHS